MNKRMKGLSGINIGSLTIIEHMGITRDGKHKVWECRCNCENTKNCTIAELKTIN